MLRFLVSFMIEDTIEMLSCSRPRRSFRPECGQITAKIARSVSHTTAPDCLCEFRAGGNPIRYQSEGSVRVDGLYAFFLVAVRVEHQYTGTVCEVPSSRPGLRRYETTEVHLEGEVDIVSRRIAADYVFTELPGVVSGDYDSLVRTVRCEQMSAREVIKPLPAFNSFSFLPTNPSASRRIGSNASTDKRTSGGFSI